MVMERPEAIAVEGQEVFITTLASVQLTTLEKMQMLLLPEEGEPSVVAAVVVAAGEGRAEVAEVAEVPEVLGAQEGQEILVLQQIPLR
jgi:hypothetical protein